MYIASTLVLLFLAVTFIQSGYDKIADWNGNVSWLKSHFAETFLKDVVPAALMIILLLEIISGVLCVVGSLQILMNSGRNFAFYGAVFSAITLLFLLLGQRVAKDYDGARTIAIYFIPAIMAVNWLS